MRQCRTCRETLHEAAFTLTRDGYRKDCKECYADRERIKYQCRKNKAINALLRWPAPRTGAR